jgi:hypothetical protein
LHSAPVCDRPVPQEEFMYLRRSDSLVGLLAVAMILMLVACSMGPSAPEKGTPEFYWQAAKEAFLAADYLKAADHIEQIERSENPFTAKARTWKLVLNAGLTKGFMDLADNYEYGARANKANPTPFRRRVSDYRGMAGRMSLQFAETFLKFFANKDPEIVLAFPFPTGSAGQVVALNKVANGIFPAEAEADAAQTRTLGRDVLLAVAKAVGAGEDTAKARALFQGADVKVPRATFILAMATALYDQSQLYGPLKLDTPEKLKMFANYALDAAKSIPETKESKALIAKIQAALKKARG